MRMSVSATQETYSRGIQTTYGGKQMKRPNHEPMKTKTQPGFTLMELVIVLAIVVVLASIFLPMGVKKLQKADDATADATVAGIGAALGAFFEDLRHFPVCDTGCGSVSGLATNKGISFLAFGDGSGDLSGQYPDSTGTWSLTTNDNATPAKNNGYNHLVTNDPGADGTANDGTNDYPTTGSFKWSGPYLFRTTTDPWGKAYIANVGAMESGGTGISAAGLPATPQFGWILSAGPDKVLDTLPTDTQLQNDDRGFIFHTEF